MTRDERQWCRLYKAREKARETMRQTDREMARIYPDIINARRSWGLRDERLFEELSR
jgi:vacuolar-type H+-ATPase subunit H